MQDLGGGVGVGGVVALFYNKIRKHSNSSLEAGLNR